jgi:DNA repair protein RadD
VGVLTVGFDFPELDTIIIARPTLSLALYMQMIGRGIRKAEGKKDCAIVDLCGNYNRFGKIEDIKYVTDENDKWVIKSGEKLLSGIPLIK